MPECEFASWHAHSIQVTVRTAHNVAYMQVCVQARTCAQAHMHAFIPAPCALIHDSLCLTWHLLGFAGLTVNALDILAFKCCEPSSELK